MSKNEPIETNSKGGKQSVSPYAMHLIDPYFLRDYMSNDAFIRVIASCMIEEDKADILIAINILCESEGISGEQMLLNISKVRKEASIKYPPQNWRLIPQEEHLNHALVHYLAYKMGDTQDEHLDHCLCRLMFAYSTKVSKNFSYTEAE